MEGFVNPRRRSLTRVKGYKGGERSTEDTDDLSSISVGETMSNPAPDLSWIHLTNNLHHDVYPAIDPRGALKGSCRGKSVLVTGAGRGIGKAIAVAFAHAGAATIVLASRTLSELEGVRDDIASLELDRQPRVLIQATDVTSEESVRALFDTVEREHVYIDVLVNNAGHLGKTPLVHLTDPAEWWETWEVNVKGTYLPTYHLLKSIFSSNVVAPAPVTILCTATLSGPYSRFGFSGYQPSKSAINRFAEFLNAEYEDKGVRAYAYHPGGVLTKLALEGMPPETFNTIMIDKPELAGGFCVFLSAPGKYQDTDIFKGKFVSANWDVDDMVKKGKEMAGDDRERRWLMTKVLVF
ncbi:NAD(P)-binding protein [Daedalea quercina L-15889]|uniref:NAD(P)-binding protein n=1 Tax=Daedalea quercina L-15889 TaxID=1314783 RepID=A0A165MPD2_9APHY|nr:NAD(P)-binding protein [Daedalea quercina L-15889]